MVLTVNGTDIVPYIANQGLKWTRNDVDGPNAGRLMNGDMVRDRVATKIRWDVSCKPLTAEELSTVLSAIAPEFVEVEYTDPVTNTLQTGTFYSNNFPVSFLLMRRDGTEYWQGLAFPLVMR